MQVYRNQQFQIEQYPPTTEKKAGSLSTLCFPTINCNPILRLTSYWHETECIRAYASTFAYVWGKEAGFANALILLNVEAAAFLCFNSMNTKSLSIQEPVFGSYFVLFIVTAITIYKSFRQVGIEFYRQILLNLYNANLNSLQALLENEAYVLEPDSLNGSKIRQQQKVIANKIKAIADCRRFLWKSDDPEEQAYRANLVATLKYLMISIMITFTTIYQNTQLKNCNHDRTVSFQLVSIITLLITLPFMIYNQVYLFIIMVGRVSFEFFEQPRDINIHPRDINIHPRDINIHTFSKYIPLQTYENFLRDCIRSLNGDKYLRIMGEGLTHLQEICERVYPQDRNSSNAVAARLNVAKIKERYISGLTQQIENQVNLEIHYIDKCYEKIRFKVNKKVNESAIITAEEKIAIKNSVLDKIRNSKEATENSVLNELAASIDIETPPEIVWAQEDTQTDRTLRIVCALLDAYTSTLSSDADRKSTEESFFELIILENQDSCALGVEERLLTNLPGVIPFLHEHPLTHALLYLPNTFKMNSYKEMYLFFQQEVQDENRTSYATGFALWADRLNKSDFGVLPNSIKNFQAIIANEDKKESFVQTTKNVLTTIVFANIKRLLEKIPLAKVSANVIDKFSYLTDNNVKNQEIIDNLIQKIRQELNTPNKLPEFANSFAERLQALFFDDTDLYERFLKEKSSGWETQKQNLLVQNRTTAIKAALLEINRMEFMRHLASCFSHLPNLQNEEKMTTAIDITDSGQTNPLHEKKPAIAFPVFNERMTIQPD